MKRRRNLSRGPIGERRIAKITDQKLTISRNVGQVFTSATTQIVGNTNSGTALEQELNEPATDERSSSGHEDGFFSVTIKEFLRIDRHGPAFQCSGAFARVRRTAILGGPPADRWIRPRRTVVNLEERAQARARLQLRIQYSDTKAAAQ